jgi:hypothetical protein
MSTEGPEGRSPRALAVAIAAIAVLAAAFVVLDAVIARRQNDAAHDQADLAVAVGARVTGVSYGSQFRCEAMLIEARQEFLDAYQRQTEGAGVATDLGGALVRAADRAAAVSQDVVEALVRPPSPSTGLDPDALSGFEEGRCAADREPFTGAEGVLDRQQAAARRANDLGTAGGRVSTALALTTVATVLLTLGEAAHRNRRGRLPSVLGALVLVASLGWAASALTAL